MWSGDREAEYDEVVVHAPTAAFRLLHSTISSAIKSTLTPLAAMLATLPMLLS